jgi:hypothetical protein
MLKEWIELLRSMRAYYLRSAPIGISWARGSIYDTQTAGLLAALEKAETLDLVPREEIEDHILWQPMDDAPMDGTWVLVLKRQASAWRSDARSYYSIHLAHYVPDTGHWENHCGTRIMGIDRLEGWIKAPANTPNIENKGSLEELDDAMEVIDAQVDFDPLALLEAGPNR